jgi:hypothetical protein
VSGLTIFPVTREGATRFEVRDAAGNVRAQFMCLEAAEMEIAEQSARRRAAAVAAAAIAKAAGATA